MGTFLTIDEMGEGNIILLALDMAPSAPAHPPRSQFSSAHEIAVWRTDGVGDEVGAISKATR